MTPLCVDCEERESRLCIECATGQVDKPKQKTYEYTGQMITRCQCGAYIYFIMTDAGRSMPVAVQTHALHFIDCHDRDKFRKGKATR